MESGGGAPPADPHEDVLGGGSPRRGEHGVDVSLSRRLLGLVVVLIVGDDAADELPEGGSVRRVGGGGAESGEVVGLLGEEGFEELGELFVFASGTWAVVVSGRPVSRGLCWGGCGNGSRPWCLVWHSWWGLVD